MSLVLLDVRLNPDACVTKNNLKRDECFEIRPIAADGRFKNHVFYRDFRTLLKIIQQRVAMENYPEQKRLK